MKKVFVIFFIGCVVLYAISAQQTQQSTQAQSPKDALQKAQTTEKEGEQAYNQGYYNDATKDAIVSEQYAELAGEWYTADADMIKAKNSIIQAVAYKLETRDPALYKKASEAMILADTNYKNKQFETAITYAKQVVDLLKNITPVAGEKYYTVRKLVPADCFWRIASYKEVYNDASKWRLIYEANKKVLQDPKNPNLIQPGMVFVIPPLK